MATWNASYEKGVAYEINFCSAIYEEAKAVEKVCCAIMDKKVSTPDDVQIVRHGKWITKDVGFLQKSLICSACGGWEHNLACEHEDINYCPQCGAKMDGD